MRHALLLSALILSTIFAPVTAVEEKSNISEGINSSNESLLFGNESASSSENLNVMITASPTAEKPEDNIKDLVEIPETGESPLALKKHIVKEMSALKSGEYANKLEEIIEPLRRSIESNFWDEYHIKSGEAFKEDKHAAQNMRILLDGNNKSDLNYEAILECLAMLVQADKILAYKAMEDATNASFYISNPAILDEINRLIETAEGEYNKAVEHIQKGDHVVAIEFFGRAWENTNMAITITDRNSVPKVTLSSPENGVYTNVSLQLAEGSVDDVAVYTIKNVSMNLNGITSEIPLVNGRFSHRVTLIEGINSIQIIVEDAFANTGTASASLTLDTIAPTIIITGVENGTYYNRDVRPDVSVSDANLQSYSIILNNVPYSGALITEEGSHLLEVYANDLAGNSAYAKVEFIIDKTPPEVEITAPINNTHLRQIVEIKGSASDLNLDNYSLRIDDIEVSSSLPHIWDTTNYADGFHAVELYAEDKAGNNASVNIYITLDNTPPEVSFTNPKNNSFVRQILNVEGSAADANLNMTSLSIDGVEIASSLPYTWDTASYSDGAHTLRLSASDLAGNEASAEVNVTVDNTAPVVKIISPPNGALLRHIVEINGTIVEANLDSINLKIDGIAVAGSIPYLWDTSAYPDGEHRIELNASDKANNYAIAGVNVTIDNTPPVLTVSELSLNPLNNSEYALLITTEANANVTVNNKHVLLENNSAIYRANITLGINDFVVTAIDIAGNPSTWKKTLLVDEDLLPDWYEINITGTNPLDGDSDSSLTIGDESDNGISDDNEDFDSDKVLNKEEFAYSLDPFNPDTDSDGLTDWHELRIFGTSPLLIDSDDNGVNDSDEDKDADLLINLDEQEHDTNPFSNDTDEDGLSDHREIVELNTSPLKKDTDNDFLDDSVELKPFFNTDPLEPDTNGNGILDGNETYEQTSGNETLGIEVEINASDDREGSFIFDDIGNKLQLDSDVLIGKPVNILAKKKFSTIKIKMYYNDSGIANESNLALFYFDEANHSFLLLEKHGVNTEENYVWGEADHLSGYLVLDGQMYYDRFANANAPTIPQLKAGDEIEIYAKVHNLEQAEAKNVEVAFYNGDPDNGSDRGEYIGTNITPSIGKGQSAVASMKWKINFNKGLNIFVKVDPNSTVEELKEDNNIANRFLDNKSVDSDGDGLTDYDEVNGLRTAMGLTFFTNRSNPDTDGDGLDDGKEMGPVMELNQSRYYFLFSYPSTEADGSSSSITNSVDSDDDRLSDKDEYYFGSSGLYKDSDADGLNDIEEYQLDTLPRDPDTDRDGLTDWWETKADININKYGHTDPKKRDSDTDFAIDGGESNVYPDTRIDVDGDGYYDSGETMDLNGDGIIEFGEENYYETPPNEVTYFLDIFAVADKEYRDYYKKSWDADYYKKWINFNVDWASDYFMRNFSIKLKVVEISEKVWNSDDAISTQKLRNLLEDAYDEYSWATNKRNADALLAFTGKDPDYEGIAFSDSVAIQIPELSDPRPAEFLGYLKYLGFFFDRSIEKDWTPRLVQHEVSHLFGAYDYGLENPNYHVQDNITGERLARIPGIMDKTKPSEDPEGFKADQTGNIWLSNEWNLESIIIINSNKTSVTNGSYKKYK